MPKLGAGLLMYRKGDQGPKVLLVHPGGPFFKNKDETVWSLPKGLADDGEVGEQLLEVAKREFEEETGPNPSDISNIWAPFVAALMARQSTSGRSQVTVTPPRSQAIRS
jgi:predicted NUDIX family NTP pyrophosphohydrolase